MPDLLVPAVPAEGNIAEADLDPRRHDELDPTEPHRLIDAWRAEHLETTPPAGYLDPS